MVNQTMSTPSDETKAAPEGPVVPNFKDDQRARERYASMLDRRKKAFAVEHEGSVRRNSWAKRDELREELDKAGDEWEKRKEAAEQAKEAYGKAYPQHIRKTRFVEPSGMENLKSFGAASKLYNAAKDAWLAAAEAESDIRRIEHNENQVDIELKKALERAPAVIKEVTDSDKWLAEIHAEEDMGNARARVAEIDAERAAYAQRLASGKVPDDELRLRAFAENDVKHVELPLDGVIFYRIETYGKKSYVILRDLRKQLFALPYDARIEPLFNGVYDVARKEKEFVVRRHEHPNSKNPFTLLDHFKKCNDDQDEPTQEDSRKHQEFIRQRRMLATNAELDELETQTMTLLTEFVAAQKA